jgi:surfactin synthase thioesterase subunit
LLPGHIDVCAVELRGRGTRAAERPTEDIEAVAEEIVGTLAPIMDRPAVLFGHSLGARIGFVVAQRESRFRTLIASGARPPTLASHRLRADLPAQDLIEDIVAFGGTAPEILADPEIMGLFLPVIRADFRLNERQIPAFDSPIDRAIVALAAHDDREVSVADISKWRSSTTGSFRLVPLDPPAGHFFLKTRRDWVLENVRAVVDEDPP